MKGSQRICLVMTAVACMAGHAQGVKDDDVFPKTIEAPVSASSWFQGDLTARWAEVVAGIEKRGAEETLGTATNEVIDDPELFSEAQAAFFHNLPLLNRVLMEKVAEQDAEDFMRGPEWTLEVRLHAGLFPAAYATSTTYKMTFQIDLPSYALIRRRLEAAVNHYRFGVYDNPEAESMRFYPEGNKLAAPTGMDESSLDDFCPAPLVNRMVWLITSCVTHQCPGMYLQYRNSYEECSDGTTRHIIGCYFSFVGCPQ